MKAAISWSAGKDSCLALLRAREAGHDVHTFLTMMEPDRPRNEGPLPSSLTPMGGGLGASPDLGALVSKSHELPAALIEAQVRALGGRWQPAAAGPGEYARVFDEQLQALRESGHTHMVFGDIDLQAHRDWLEPACARAGLEAVFPLWGQARSAIAEEIIARGIRARLVCIDRRWLTDDFCGTEYDAELLARLPAGVCPCGEGGEFHTFVWGGPGFVAPLPIGPGVQRRVASQPPLAPTELVFQIPTLLAP